MRRAEKWLVPVFFGLVIAAAAAVAACGQDAARPVASNTADSSGSDSTPPDTVPPDTVPPDTVPRDSLPPDSLPPDSLPPDSLPPDSLPPPSGAASITVTPASQERAVGDSGWVTATVQDSAGREISPAAIEWDLRETSSVLRITTRSSNYVVFDAVGRGRAVLIARFQALADTAIVFVR